MNLTKLKIFLIFTFLLVISIYSLFDENDSITQLNKYFYNCEYQRAIELSKKLLKDSKLSSKDIKRTYLIKGVSEFSSNQILDSKITFVQLVVFDRNFEISSKNTSPKIINFFNEIKKEVISTTSSKSKIDSAKG